MFTCRLGKSSVDVKDELAVHVSQTQQELEPEETEERRETNFHGETQRRRQHKYIRCDTKPQLSILVLGYFQFSWIFDVLSIFCQTEEGAPPVVGKWRFVRVEAPTAGWSLPCWLLLSPYSCPASAEGTSWGRIRSAESWIKK